MEPKHPSEKVIIALEIIKLISKFGFYSLIGFGFYMAYLSIKELAGLHTIADLSVVIDALEKSDSSSVPWFIAGGTTIWALGEKLLRHKKVERLTAHTKDLELMIDQNRTSSMLTRQGNTNPGDK